MSKITKSYPYFAKSTYILIGIIALIYLVILGKSILSPLLFSFLFSILLLPIAKFLENKCKIPRGFASFIAVIFFIAIISLVFYFVGSQIQKLATDWPLFKEQLATSTEKLQVYIAQKFKINADEQLNYVHATSENIIASGTVVFGATMLSLSTVVLFLIFTFIYTFFFLLYRSLILKFIIAVFNEQNSGVVHDIVEQVQFIVRKYITGLILEMLIVSGVVCIAFLSLGIKYGMLLGIITGLFNIIPYVGIFTALLLSVLITFATAGVFSKVILVFVIIVVIHLIDSNILLPLIVGSKVKINAFVTVIGVVLGEMIWGISGMFLSIPIIAVLKIIFDRIEGLQPWGILLGEDDRIKDQLEKRKKDLEASVHIKS